MAAASAGVVCARIHRLKPVPQGGAFYGSERARELLPLRLHPQLRRDPNVSSSISLYVDADAWFEPYADTYDTGGNLWKNVMHFVAYRDRPVPDARVAIYPFKRLFEVGSSTLDCQSKLSTVCYLPSRDAPERDTWYINMGAVNENFFTSDALEKAANGGH